MWNRNNKTVENLSEKLAKKGCENEEYIKSLLQDTATEKKKVTNWK